ncbi:histone-lysine N-methyltransferase SETDB1-like isoform X3 [Corticium candelabrum]|uniref:histone-lysine N-methyltransferase SETDB1-like isoform X3 n=1 Tax=Corticium candelabrum TaxID=121492 RepID=UPI002E277210|nr:histone-lysine N-methyltransferase SETDB1-like isoform X3 [Corticium candelabrum]
MTSWVWSVSEDEWPMAKQDKEMLMKSVATQLDSLNVCRRCETFCKQLQGSCDVIEREQRENLSAVTSMCEEIFSLEKQFDPSVSSTERNSISPYMLTSTDEYEVSNDIIVISESSEMEEGDGKEEYEENTVETRDHMTQTVEVMKRDDKSEGTEWMGEGRNEDRNVKEWKRNRRSLPSCAGQRVVARKSSETWWAKGTFMKIATNKAGQIVYHIHFDKGDKGQINPRFIAALSHPEDGDLHVGSRVVGIYAKWNKLYGGIVAEVACERNRSRHLVFYDDGFAQYMTNRELHEVIMPSEEVWKDVADHSREFIKEYLEAYPMRPLMEVKVGDTVNTEWRRTWSLATVESVDCSLVKMKFNSAREEWIYRGSPRLEPVYRFLESIDDEREAWITQKGKNNVPTVKDLLSAHEYPWQVGGHLITCPNVTGYDNDNHDDHDDDITIVCVKDATGRTQHMTVRSEEKQEVVHNDSSLHASITARHQQESQSRALARKSTTRDTANPPLCVDDGMADGSNNSETGGNKKDQCKDDVMEGQWEAPWLKFPLRQVRLDDETGIYPSPEKQRVRQTGKCVKDVASCLLKKLGNEASKRRDDKANYSSNSKNSDGRLRTEKIRNTWSSLARYQAAQYVEHECSVMCRPLRDLPASAQRLCNPLSIPLMLGWKREIVRRLHPHKTDVFYRTPAPCNRRLRCMGEVADYLYQTAVENLNIDQFTFDTSVSLSTNSAVPGEEPYVYIDDLSEKEEKPISCINEINNEQPPSVKYVSNCIYHGVNVNLDSTFLVCCDCTDDCQDKESCACFQLTREAGEAVGIDCDAVDVGYTFRRIQNAHRTAIYECNSRCKCSSHCANRVVQHGIQVRLQVFKTSQKGWGVRLLDDVQKGTFICCYAGQLLTEEDANKEGRRHGDEYIAELDHIEVVEKMKEGYESDVSDLSSTPLSSVSEQAESEEEGATVAAETLSESCNIQGDDENMLVLGQFAAPMWCRFGLVINNNDVEKAAKWLKERKFDLQGESLAVSKAAASPPVETVAKDNSRATTGIWSMISKYESLTSVSTANSAETSVSLSHKELSGNCVGGYRVTVKATSGRSRSASVERVNEQENTENSTRLTCSGTRSLYGDLGCYAVDTKSTGNVGRYLNHSCSPNLFVQNVFVDTHDLRFPWVAFFSKHTIKAMTELTWDYNYEVGSVPGRELKCYCGAKECRGRLL